MSLWHLMTRVVCSREVSDYKFNITSTYVDPSCLKLAHIAPWCSLLPFIAAVSHLSCHKIICSVFVFSCFCNAARDGPVTSVNSPCKHIVFDLTEADLTVTLFSMFVSEYSCASKHGNTLLHELCPKAGSIRFQFEYRSRNLKLKEWGIAMNCMHWVRQDHVL